MKKLFLVFMSMMLISCLVGCSINYEKVNINFIIDGKSYLVEIDKGGIISKDIIPLENKENVELYYDEKMENKYNNELVIENINIFVKVNNELIRSEYNKIGFNINEFNNKIYIPYLLGCKFISSGYDLDEDINIELFYGNGGCLEQLGDQYIDKDASIFIQSENGNFTVLFDVYNLLTDSFEVEYSGSPIPDGFLYDEIVYKECQMISISKDVFITNEGYFYIGISQGNKSKNEQFLNSPMITLPIYYSIDIEKNIVFFI